VEEILETCSVAIALGGTMAGGETARVVQLLSELGKIKHSSDFEICGQEPDSRRKKQALQCP
jgi:hypothetical protein